MINVKMKMVDPEQVTALMVKAVEESLWADDETRKHAHSLVHDITLALAHAAVVMIEPDLT